jgi:nitroreductase
MRLDEQALDLLFRQARSHNGWTGRDVPVELLHELYAIVRMGPTCANSNPSRFLFLRSKAARQELATMVAAGNVDKVTAAPVVAIIGYDLEFHEHLPRLFAHNLRMQTLYANNSQLAETTALRNSSLQGAYLMLAARALGLDCGPMSGFDHAAVDKRYFADSAVRSNFLCCLGYGDRDKLFERLPRLAFDEACEIL